MTRLILVMGVSGCGKTTLGALLAERIGGTYIEGDDHHPPENKIKMGNGIPLVDDDRWPWFDALIAISREALSEGVDVVLTCSALKQSYRDYLLRDFPDAVVLFLEGDFATIKQRMDEREHEYMTSTLLESQFATLEEPEEGERVLRLRNDVPPRVLVDTVVDWLT